MSSRVYAASLVGVLVTSGLSGCTKSGRISGDEHRDSSYDHESGQSLHAKRLGTSHDSGHGSQGSGANAGYLAAITPLVQTPVIPQCKPQRNAPRGQLAASYFEEMQACAASLPPQLTASGDAGRIDENGDCNLGTVGATEVVCHYHPSYEFTSSKTPPADPAHTVEVHCIAFKLEHGERILTPIVFGTQLTCKADSMPGSGGHSESHGSTHDGTAACGQRIPELFTATDSCDMRCCRDGTLTKANPGMAVRPSFAICANPKLEVDCAGVLAGMHAHAAHRPHDRVGPEGLYKKPMVTRRTSSDRDDRAPRPENKGKIKDTDMPPEELTW